MTLKEAREKYVGRMVLTDLADCLMPRSCKWDNPVVTGVISSNNTLYAVTVLDNGAHLYLPVGNLLLPEDYLTHKESINA